MSTPRTQLTGHCEQYDHPLRFTVASHSEPGAAYIVDLGTFQGNGSCNCPHFQRRVLPLIEAGAPPGPQTRCKHIATARAKFVDLQIQRMLQHEQDLRTEQFNRQFVAQ